MKANELRIGNYISRLDVGNDSERIEKVIEIGKKALISGPISVICSYDEINPIPLTKDWLLKFGGIKDEFGDIFVYLNKELDLRFYLTSGFIQLCKGHSAPIFNFTHITSVHLFQNLYWGMSYVELELK